MSEYKKGKSIYKDSQIQSKLVQKIYTAIEKYHPILQKYMKVKTIVVVCDENRCDIGGIKGKGQIMVIGVPLVKNVMTWYKLNTDRAVRQLMTHESIHSLGLQHDYQGYKRGFFSHMDKDTYTPKVEK